MNTNKDLTQYNKDKEEFYKAILLLETIEDCDNFFEDICTINELKLISQRLQVAKLLKKGVTFNEIVRLTGASTATISRVNRALMYGSGSYTKIIDTLENNEN
ncbi:MAG: hypothetical protein IKL09_09270 [Clostridia bacterium]|nr:hypothetical protein [Clostridia bacterium]